MGPIPFNNSYARLPAQLYTRLEPTAVSAPTLIRANHALARQLGIDADWLQSDQGIATIAGNHIPAGAEPLAAVYSGHQFGSYNPQLGDGRALLLGEVIDVNGQRRDIQLKGSGPTPYSRGGDGRSPLGPVIREYIVSEAMHALGVPTTRALAAVTTGDAVMRDTVLPGAVLARVAASHIRIGTFQFFAASKDSEALKSLVEHCLQRHYPQQAASDNPALALLQAVIRAQARLISRWQLLGFIHGVMNTDNMLIGGETVDYGPCAFMDEFDPAKVFSSIDRGGRYAYRNQPGIAHWNLAVLAQALLPLLHDGQEQAVALAQEAVDEFPALFEAAHLQGLADKLGVAEVSEADKPLVDELFQLMSDEHTDFTLTFRRLYDHANNPQAQVGQWFELPDSFIPWLSRWRKRLETDQLTAETREQRMRRANPALIPRNHKVEAVIRAAEDENDLAPFNAMVERLADPFELDSQSAEYILPPRPEEAVTRTFCGT
ncbi:protein adenylyltransferase SelO [Pseudohalioglobus lutimaris]|uniref:Protein nucleotidyltransferase YdiU n=1 Tax=Pseudohalioglobus lutimaris TaxID=1737061 RepID=A0A2N5WZM3_9GAMM|nr:YdiU family protein [Pseudohalioglobus lutimaris]PLW67695.1 YdiU family protein [Pseudohalioglobus lutimaris]